MLKNIFMCFLLILISGCDINFSAFRQIKWATVDSSKLRQIIGERFKVENPYPDEINKNFEEVRRERSRISQQISDITSAGTVKCQEIATENNNAAQAGSTVRQAYGVNIQGLNPSQMYQLQNNSKYQNCIMDLRNDQLILDLREKISKIEEIFNARQKHDRLVMEKTSKYVDEIISTYAESNNFELIISKSPSDIAYNKSKVTLDITDAVLSSMSKKPIE